MKNRVMVIFVNSDYDNEEVPFPPIGTKGTVISPLDEFNEFDVMFDDYPCPANIPDESWVTHRLMVVFIDDEVSTQYSEMEMERND